MVKLSVNINKIATLRNSRGGNNPDLLKMANDIQSFGAHGITIHPRPDQRHIKYSDALDLKDPCVGIRAVPVGEAMLSCVLLDHYLMNKGQCS